MSALPPAFGGATAAVGRQHQYVPFGCSRSAANSSLSSFGIRERPLSPALFVRWLRRRSASKGGPVIGPEDRRCLLWSTSDSRVSDLTAGNLTPKLSVRIADVHVGSCRPTAAGGPLEMLAAKPTLASAR